MLEQDTIKRTKGQHLTEIERGEIALLHDPNYSNRQNRVEGD